MRIARAVLGIGGGGFWGWWDEFGVADLDLVAYLERALEALEDDDDEDGLGAAVRTARPARGRGLLRVHA